MTGRNFTVDEAIREIFNDSDSENEPDMDDMNDEQIADDGDVQFETNEEHTQHVNRGRGMNENVNNEFQWEWELSGLDDPYEMEWLREFDTRRH